MIKFVVAFRESNNIAEFENAYNDFLALVERMPSIIRRQVVHVIGSPLGDAPYARQLELYFNTQQEFRDALLSPQGQEAGNELARFGKETIDVFFAEVYEEGGGQTPS